MVILYARAQQPPLAINMTIRDCEKKCMWYGVVYFFASFRIRPDLDVRTMGVSGAGEGIDVGGNAVVEVEIAAD